jgi:hypothetical protein
MFTKFKKKMKMVKTWMINLWVKAIYIVLNPCNCIYEKDIMINTSITCSFGLLGNISLK